jgi:hypothetical protein
LRAHNPNDGGRHARKLACLLTVVAALGLALGAARPGLAQAPAGLDTAAIERATGLKGTMITDENVFKVSKPRTDVKINVDGWTMPPFMGLGSWAAFTPAHGGNHVMLMGDTVLFEDEVNPAMSAALDAGLEVTAPCLVRRQAAPISVIPSEMRKSGAPSLPLRSLARILTRPLSMSVRMLPA